MKTLKEKEDAGRNIFQSWLQNQNDIQLLCYTDVEERFDCIFFSAGTQMLCEIKNRKFSSNFLLSNGAEVDASKARYLYKTTMKNDIVPIVVSITNDGKMIFSDIRKIKKNDVSLEWRQKTDQDKTLIQKEVANLSGCTFQIIDLNQ